MKERDRRDKLEERRKEKRVTEANEVRIKLSLETKVVNFKILWNWLTLDQTSRGVIEIYPMT